MSEQKRKRGRQCLIVQKNFQTQEVQEIKATFHCWGSRAPKDPAKNIKHYSVMETVGICELPNGAIWLIKPENIRFTDGGEK